jgi:hypothetical protein
MNFFHEFALLIAIAVPVAAIVGMHAFLLLGGERGTLLWPSARPLETGFAAVSGFEPERAVATIPACANDEHDRRAA